MWLFIPRDKENRDSFVELILDPQSNGDVCDSDLSGK
jgi:hypothetical protein